MRVVLTDAMLRTLRPPGSGRVVLRDAKVVGLELRLSATGAAAWSVRGTLPTGRRVRATLGSYPALGLAEARRLALETLGRIAQGHDPVAERRAARAAEAARAEEEARRAREAAEAEEAARLAAEAERAALGPTVRERWQEWVAIVAKTARRGRGWSDARAERVDWVFRAVVAPAFADKPLRAVTGAEWKALITQAHRERGPAAAANIARVISPFLNFAALSEWIPASPLARGVVAHLAPPSPPRERTLDDRELRLVWDAAARLPAKTRAFVRLLVLTGCRRGEVAGITVGEVSLDRGEWALPAARVKNRLSRSVPLGPLALAEIRAVWPEGDVPDSHHLLGRFPSTPLSGFSKAKVALDRYAVALAAERGERPPEPWDWHDLRRTCRTGLSRLGVAFEAAEAAIGHVVAKTALAKTYDHHRFEAEARDALLRWQAHVAAAVGENIVSLADHRARAG